MILRPRVAIRFRFGRAQNLAALHADEQYYTSNRSIPPLRRPRMAKMGLIQSDEITKNEFSELLAQYPSLVEAISVSKGGKSGLGCVS